MNILYSRKFVKSYKTRIKPVAKIRRQFEERVRLFITNPKNPLLRDHKLVGKFRSFRSFSISGDIRVIYSVESK